MTVRKNQFLMVSVYRIIISIGLKLRGILLHHQVSIG